METTGAPFDLDTVKAIDLSFSQKDRIQTWKKNRRAIVNIYLLLLIYYF